MIDNEKSTSDRQELIAAFLQLVGTQKEVSKICNVTEQRVRNWVYEGRINRYHLPELIKAARKKGLYYPWSLLVQTRPTCCDWPIDRLRLDEIIIIMGGHKRVAQEMGLNRMTVKNWSQAARVFDKYALEFVTQCAKAYNAYTGCKLPSGQYIRPDGYLDTYKLYNEFRKKNLVFKKRSRKYGAPVYQHIGGSV